MIETANCENHLSAQVDEMRRPLQRLGTVVPRCIRSAQLHRTCIAQRSLSMGSRPTTRCSRTSHTFPTQFSRRYAKEVPTPNTKGISQTEYELRRAILSESLPDGAVCVLVGASMKYSSDSVL